METKEIDKYFNKARQLPIALSLAEVQSIVSVKGVTSPPNKSWWNLNNIIIMTTTTLFISIALNYLSNTTDKLHYQSPEPYTFENKEFNYLIPVDSIERKSESIEKSVSLFEETLENMSDPILELGKEPTVIINEEIELLEESQELITEVLENEVELNVIFENDENDSDGLFSSDIEENIIESSSIIEGESKTITKSIAAEGLNWFVLKANRGNIKIESWDQTMVELKATVNMEGDSDEDVKKGLEDFKVSLIKEGDHLNVKHNWEELSSCMCVSYNWLGKKKNKGIKTESGEKLDIEKVNVSYIVKVPRSLNLELKNSYADIQMGDIDGDLKATLFKGNLNAGNIDGKLKLSEKYGDAKVGNYNSGKIELFKGEAELGKTNELDITAKYSKVKMGETIELELEAFKSDVTINGNSNSIDGTFKYGDLEMFGDVKEFDLILFKSDVEGKSIEKAELSASYSDLEFNQIGELELKNAFQSDIIIGTLNSIKGNMKYTPLKIGKLGESIDLVTFKGKIDIEEVNSSFTQVELKTKYTDIDLNFNPDSKYNLEAETTYTELQLPDEVMNFSHQRGVSNNVNHFKGTFNGASAKAASTVYVNSFQGHLNFK